MLQVTPSDMFISYLHTSCLKILKSSIFHVGTQKMQLHSAREDPNLLPDIVKYNWLQQMAPKNSSDPSWQILGTHYSTLHSPFYTRLFAWRKWFYHVWMHVYSRVAVMLTSLLFQTRTSVKNLCSPNLRKRPQHVYAPVAKEFYWHPVCWRFCCERHQSVL